MNRSQALKEAARLFGKKAAVQDGGKPSSQEQRDAAFARLKEARALRDSLDKSDPRYKAARQECLDTFGEADRYRFYVGAIGGVGGIQFFHVHGRGDTWEEAFAKVDPMFKKQAA